MAEFTNWTPDKDESPYSYGTEYPKYALKDFSWEIISEEERQEFTNEGKLENEFVSEAWVLAEMWDLHLINQLRVTRLIKPVRYLTKGGDFITDFIEIREKLEDDLDDYQPITIYVTYPFNSLIELKIHPVSVTTFGAKIKTGNYYWIGYIAWQISKLYEEIFKNEYENVGLGPHCMADLQLASMRIHKNNIITLGINS